MAVPTSLAGWVRAYYLVTPFFAAADWLGANVRAVGLAAHPEWRAAYYAICTLAGGLLYLRPRWSRVVGLLEASTNVLLLLLAVLMPYFDAVAAVAAGGSPAGLPLTTGVLINFLISGGVWVAVFQRRVLELRADAAPSDRTHIARR